MKPILRLTLPLVAALLAACKPSATPGADSGAVSGSPHAKPIVYVANYPLKYFAERIGGDAVEVHFPAPGDEDPAFWQPDDATIAKYQAADVILLNGATYSKWAEKTTLPESKITDTAKAFAKDFIEIKDAVTHSHGPGGTHSHNGTAFTTWVDFQQAIQQAEAVAKALKAAAPLSSAAFDANLKKLKADLEALDARMLAAGKRAAGAPLMASHPVYHYLVRRYGLNLKFVLWEPEIVPDDKAMEDLKQKLADHPAKWMIWEGEPAKESVAKLDALGLKSLVYDPCGNVPESGDFMTVMTANVEAFEKAFP
jgi:zinc transport system substrate-binding protein